MDVGFGCRQRRHGCARSGVHHPTPIGFAFDRDFHVMMVMTGHMPVGFARFNCDLYVLCFHRCFVFLRLAFIGCDECDFLA